MANFPQQEGWQAAYLAIEKAQKELPPLSLQALHKSRTALIVMDMVNGFVNEGPLASPRVKAIQPEITALQRRCGQQGILRLAFADCHPKESPELLTFPPHCLQGSREAALTDEIMAAGVEDVIEKNSTNGFLEPAFAAWLKAHAQLDTFLLAGDCTDLCVMHFALALKADFNRRNRASRVIVPTRLVETYDSHGHNAQLSNTMALYLMQLAGVELVSHIAET